LNIGIRDKKILSDVRMDKAREFLADAHANFKDQRYRTAINRAYYASLSALRALLILEGINPETHEGVLTMLSLRFIRTGILPIHIVKNFKSLFSTRTDVDYGDFDSAGSVDAEESLKNASELIDTVDAVRKKLLQEIE
jgi:uncharacterized protein (UPF0332 family)